MTCYPVSTPPFHKFTGHTTPGIHHYKKKYMKKFVVLNCRPSKSKPNYFRVKGYEQIQTPLGVMPGLQVNWLSQKDQKVDEVLDVPMEHFEIVKRKTNVLDKETGVENLITFFELRPKNYAANAITE
jgi:hypothetical protein